MPLTHWFPALAREGVKVTMSAQAGCAGDGPGGPRMSGHWEWQGPATKIELHPPPGLLVVECPQPPPRQAVDPTWQVGVCVGGGLQAVPETLALEGLLICKSDGPTGLKLALRPEFTH